MKKILLSIAVIGVAGALAISASNAIFSDVEMSTGNTFTAGEIDLKIDNTSYYSNTPGLYNSETSWLMKDLEEGTDFFFMFEDLKPGDWGEDTISLHVKDNDSWLCVDVTLTSDDDNGLTEPEEGDGDVTGGDGEGELADRVAFIWWADDGDNVLEEDEYLLPSGPLGALEVGETATVALADSTFNLWGDIGPFPGDDIRYIGKAWCFGRLTPEPLPQDHEGFTVPVGGNGPDVRGTGFVCDGSVEDNITQTDGMTADISFRAVQSRNNTAFVCTRPEVEPDTGTLTIIKRVPTGDADPNDFDFDVTDDGGYLVHDDVSQGSYELEAGDYTVTEEDFPGYTADFYDCGGDGSVLIEADTETVCIVVNTEDTGTLTVLKTVIIDDGGNETEDDFDLFVDGSPESFGSPIVLVAGAHVVAETGVSGYSATYGGDCDSDGNVTVPADGSASCTITNNDIAPNITLIKDVINNSGGTFGSSDFNMTVNDISVPSGTSILVDANFANVIDEDPVEGYHFENITGDPECPDVLAGTATLNEGQAITCTITNGDDPV